MFSFCLATILNRIDQKISEAKTVKNFLLTPITVFRMMKQPHLTMFVILKRSQYFTVFVFLNLFSTLFFASLNAANTASESAPAELAAAQNKASSGSLEKAIADYRRIVRSHPFSKEASTAQFAVAQLLKQKGDFDASFKAYTYLLQKYPETPHFEEAVAEQVKISNAFLQGRRVKFLGLPAFSGIEKAQDMYETILSIAPYSKYAALTQFNLGLALERQGKANEAIASYQKLIDKYPNSSIGDDALYQIGYVYMRLGTAGKSQDLSALKEAQNNFQDFLVQYPNSEKSLQAQENMKVMMTRESKDTLRIAKFYDFSKAYQASALYYNEVIRKFAQTPNATVAKGRLGELKATIGEDALHVGEQHPITGEEMALRRKLQSQVETTSLSNYDGPPKKEIVPQDLPHPEMRTNLKEVEPLDEPKAQ
ncbi:MAG: outer membrane protein assembly factor BamD [Chthoniobacterales bacterium]